MDQGSNCAEFSVSVKEVMTTLSFLKTKIRLSINVKVVSRCAKYRAA